jgi:3-oxoacyl-[acyl-carrier-protein] synthase-3
VTLWLHGLGHFHPENEITNRFLEDLDIGTNEQWVMERVGIRSRRTALDLDYIRSTRNADIRAAAEASQMSLAQQGANAARMALDRTGLSLQDIGMVIFGSSAPDWASPAEACNVARALDVDVPALDINSACTSFLAQVNMLSMMDPAKLPRFVLMVGADSLTKTVDYNDRSSAVLWGDGAAVAIVSTQEEGRAAFLGSELDSRPTAGDKVVVPRAGFFAQEGRTVQTFAIKKTREGFERLRSELFRPDRPFHFIGHQANLRMLENVCQHCDIAPEHHHTNVEWFGNTGAASSATVISQRWEKWESRDDIAVVGVGAGLTWAGYLLRFGQSA